MAERQLHERLCMHVDVVHDVGLVASVLGELEQRVWQRHAYVSAGIERYGVVAAELLKTCRENGDVYIGIDAVSARSEASQSVLRRDVRVHERCLLLVAVDAVARIVEQHVANAEVALSAHIQITQCRYRHVVLLIVESRVHSVTELIVLDEVCRVESLRHRVAAHSSKRSGEYIFTYSFHVS